MKLDNRIWILITVVVSGAVLAGAWFLGASPFLDATGQAALSLATVSAQNDETTAEINGLKKSESDLDGLRGELATYRASVPNGVDGTRFIDEVNAIADRTGVSVSTISLAAATPYAAPAAAAATTGTPGGDAGPSSEGGSPTPAPSASATATAAPTPTGPVAPLPATDPLITSSNFVVVPVVVDVTGDRSNVLQFLDGLQHGARLILPTELLVADQDGGAVTLSIKGSIYVLRSTTTTAAANG